MNLTGFCLIDIPPIIDPFLLHDFQISMSRPCYVNVFQWNRECFFLRHVELKSRFIVMTIDEVTLDPPEVSTHFNIICWFCRLRLSRFTLKFSAEMFAPYGTVRAFEWVLVTRSLFLTIFAVPSATGNMNSSSFLCCQILLSGWFFEDKFLMRQLFPNLLKSAIRISPSQNRPAISSKPRKIPSDTFLPNWWILDKPLAEIGWYSTIAPKGIIGPLNGSPYRLSYKVFPSARRSSTFRRMQKHSIFTQSWLQQYCWSTFFHSSNDSLSDAICLGSMRCWSLVIPW